MSGTGPTSREWLAVLAVGVVVAALALAPLARRTADSTPAWRHTGLTGGDFTDTASHLSWTRQIRDGWLLAENKFAGAERRGHRLYNLLFIALGLGARAAGCSVVAAYHVQLAVTAVLVPLAAFWLAATVFPDRRQRWVCLALVLTSGGLHWLEIWHLAGMERDIGMAQETNTFWMLQSELVVGPASGLVVLAMTAVLRALRHGSARRFILVGLAGFLVISVHPQEILTIGVTAGLAGLVLAWGHKRVPAPTGGRWRRLFYVLLALGVGAGPVGAYHVAVLLIDPSFRPYSGDVHHFMVLRAVWWDYGLILLLAGVGAALIVARGERDRALLVIWPAVVAAFLATPPAGHRVFVYHGLHVVLCALATRALVSAGGCLRRGWWARRPTFARATAGGALALVLGAGALTNVAVYAHKMRPWRPARYGFIPPDEWDAIAWLDDHADPHDVILSLPRVGEGLPMWTGSRVHVGHMLCTPEAGRRAFEMDQLLGVHGALTPEAAAGLLRSTGGRYLYVGPPARDLGSREAEEMLLRAGLAERAFANATTAVYRIDRGAVDAFTPATRPTAATTGRTP